MKTIKGVFPNRVSDSWWECPVWEVDTEFTSEFNLDLEQEIYNIGQLINSNTDTRSSLWDYDLPCLTQLKEYIYQTVTSAVPELMPPNQRVTFDYIMSWVNVKEPGDHIETHAHPDATIAATYYIRTSPGCGNLTLFDAGPGLNWERDMLNGTIPLRIKQIEPRAGKLVFFPAYVLHRIEENKSNDLRISLSTDMKHTFDPDSPGVPVLKSWCDSMLKIKEWQATR